MVLNKDREIIRDLAKKWMEIANLPVMAERKRLWEKVNGLDMGRPMILVESNFIDQYIADSDLLCSETIRH